LVVAATSNVAMSRTLMNDFIQLERKTTVGNKPDVALPTNQLLNKYMKVAVAVKVIHRQLVH
jgi:hypothetical protein